MLPASSFALFLLAPIAPTGDVLYEFVASSPGDRLGAALAVIGDVNGDGRHDVLIGAPRAGGVGPHAGRAVLLSGVDGAPLAEFAGDHGYDALGHAVAGPGDLDGDGVADVALAAPAGTPAAGSVQLRSGATARLLRTLTGAAPGDRFGHAVAGLGDVNLDGVPDLLVGAPHADVGGNLSGHAQVVSGATGQLLWSRTGQPFDQLGLAVAGPGDTDLDGVPDALIGAPFSDTAAFNGGSAWLLRGSDGAEVSAWHGATVGDLLGHGVCAVGDVDADGAPDLGVAIPGDDTAGFDAGLVRVHSGTGGALLHQWTGEAPDAWLLVAAGLGDVDGDGHADVGLGSTSAGDSQAGRVRVASGADGTTLHVIEGGHAFAWFGFALAGPGDLDGDGLADVLAGAPGHDDITDAVGFVRAVSCAAPVSGPTGARGQVAK